MKNKNNKTRISKGFTLIELLISFSIIAIVTGAMLSVVKFSGTRQSLMLEANKVLSAIRSAQSYSLVIPNNDQDKICGFGFYPVDEDTYKIFYVKYIGDNTDSNICDLGLDGNNTFSPSDDYVLSNWNESYELPDGIVFSSVNGTNFSSVTKGERMIFFKVPYGEVFRGGNELSGSDTQTYIISSDDGGVKTITINKFGKINLQ